MTKTTPDIIYHLTTTQAWRDAYNADRQCYRPASLETEGFVHCAGSPRSAVGVANDYFGGVAKGDLLMVKLSVPDLIAAVRFEAAAPLEGGGRSHLAMAEAWPHIYGEINGEAIMEIVPVPRCAQGVDWRWPDEWPTDEESS